MIYVSVFPFPPESSLSYIRMVVVPMGRCRLFVVVLVHASRLHSYISVINPFRCLLLIASCNECFVFPLMFR